MANIYITQEVKTEIIARSRNGERICDISRALNVPYQTVRYTVNHAGKLDECELPAIPSGFKDKEAALCIAYTCGYLGFDSELTGSICRKVGCDVEAVKDIAHWFNKNAIIKTHASHNNITKQLHMAKKAEQAAREEAAELRKENGENRKALAEFGKQVLLYEKKERELTAGNNLLKKILAGFCQTSLPEKSD